MKTQGFVWLIGQRRPGVSENLRFQKKSFTATPRHRAGTDLFLKRADGNTERTVFRRHEAGHIPGG